MWNWIMALTAWISGSAPTDSAPAKPRIRQVSIEERGVVVVDFSNHFMAVFEPLFMGPNNQVNGLARWWLVNAQDELIFEMNILWGGIDDSADHSIISMVEEYLQPDIAGYWRATVQHVTSKYIAPNGEKNESWKYIWEVVTSMEADLLALENADVMFAQPTV